MADITLSVSAQAGTTLADKLNAAYALAPSAPDQLYIVIEAAIPRHSNEVLPIPPANVHLLDYRTTWDVPSNTRMGQVTLDFGHSTGGQGNIARATVAATWPQSNSIIICQVGAVTTADHDAEDAVIEAIQARAINIVPGVSFDIEAYTVEGTWGQYVALYQGLISRSVPT